jgi:hypothetical protein
MSHQSSPNLTHRAGFRVNTVPKFMTNRLGLNSPFEEIDQIRLCSTTPQYIPEIDLPIRKQAH